VNPARWSSTGLSFEGQVTFASNPELYLSKKNHTGAAEGAEKLKIAPRSPRLLCDFS
jgi:hypothetical protein